MTRRAVVLKGEGLEVVVVPAWGGKTVSIRDRRRGLELLYEAPGTLPARRDDFGPWAFGWDDCWPSVNAGGPEFPDHGALWRLDPGVEKQTPSILTLRFDDPAGRWTLRKTWTVRRCLEVEVDIQNTCSEPVAGFWTFHGLVRLEDDLQLVFPGDDRRLTVFGPDFAPDHLPPDQTASKFWLPDRVSLGRCGIDYPGLGMSYRLEWNPAELPYLGLWVTRGGFQGQRNLAWEPSEGFYDSVDKARETGTLPSLPVGGRRKFSVRLSWEPSGDVSARFR